MIGIQNANLRRHTERLAKDLLDGFKLQINVFIVKDLFICVWSDGAGACGGGYVQNGIAGVLGNSGSA